MASASILCTVAALVFTSISGDEIGPANLGQAISQASGGNGGWLRPGQPVLIWPLDESALPALLGDREYHLSLVDNKALIWFKQQSKSEPKVQPPPGPEDPQVPSEYDPGKYP